MTTIRSFQLATLLVVLVCWMNSCSVSDAFGVTTTMARPRSTSNAFSTTAAFTRKPSILQMSSDDKKSDDGVIELATDDEESTESKPSEGDENKEVAPAPFLSQGDISDEAMNLDLKDPKQTRVIIYIILSLLPVLFLIPLMLSREFLPAVMNLGDEMPPVQI